MRLIGIINMLRKTHTASLTSTREDSTIANTIRSIPWPSHTKIISLDGIDTPNGATTSWFAVDFQ